MGVLVNIKFKDDNKEDNEEKFGHFKEMKKGNKVIYNSWKVTKIR